MMNTFKFFIAVTFIAIVSGDRATNVRPNHDCSCKGYEAKALQCEWDASIQKCVETSDAYINYKFWCEKLNNFRKNKRAGRRPNNYNRTLTCDAYKSEEQRRKEKCGLKIEHTKMKRSLPLGSIPTTSVTSPFSNWTSTMSPVKNQGGCGSCWAFASIALCEWYLKNHDVPQYETLSDQHLVDCDLSNGGCNGGWPTKSLNYLFVNGTSNSKYAYTATRGTCQSPLPYPRNKKCPKAIYEWNLSATGNDDRLRQVLTKTPVLGAMNVISSFFQYKSGIYTPTNCTNQVNHAILVVGHGVDNVTNQKYWICRNSWGTGWGEGGYFKMDANTPNQCGISSYFWYY